MHRILFVFLDGVGLGPPGPHNPLSQHDGTALRRLAGDERWVESLPERTEPHHVVRALDATLGVEGLPQSGTGQATLLTGVNCAELVGRHFGPFPHSTSHEVLDHDNLFHRLQQHFPSHPAPAAFANAFPPQFFRASRRRDTVTTRCCRGAGVPLRDIDALRNGRAVAADLTAAAWRDMLRLDVSVRTEAAAAEDLVSLQRDHALTLFEYFYTDKVGHDRIDRPAAAVLDALERFFAHLLDQLNPEADTLLVTSDHGNVEDRTHAQHTRNPVPLLVWGWAAPHFADAQDLTDVTPSILEALQDNVVRP